MDTFEGFRRLVWDPGGIFTYLGVTFSLDISIIVDLNHSKVIKDIQEIMSHWSKRRLTVLGRVTIVKTIIIPKLNFLFFNIHNPNSHILKRIESLMFSFVWGGQDRIKRSQFCQSHDNGGVKMVNILEFIHSLKLTWLRRFYKSNHNSCLYSMFTFFLKDHIEFLYEGGVEYLKKREYYVRNPFYKDALNALIQLKLKLFSETYFKPNSDLFLWYNDKIQVANKPIFMRDWYNKGVLYIYDLLKDN